MVANDFDGARPDEDAIRVAADVEGRGEAPPRLGEAEERGRAEHEPGQKRASRPALRRRNRQGRERKPEPGGAVEGRQDGAEGQRGGDEHGTAQTHRDLAGRQRPAHEREQHARVVPEGQAGGEEPHRAVASLRARRLDPGGVLAQSELMHEVDPRPVLHQPYRRREREPCGGEQHETRRVPRRRGQALEHDPEAERAAPQRRERRARRAVRGERVGDDCDGDQREERRVEWTAARSPPGDRGAREPGRGDAESDLRRRDRDGAEEGVREEPDGDEQRGGLLDPLQVGSMYQKCSV